VTRVTLLVNSGVFGRPCPACAARGCACLQQSKRIFDELVWPATLLECNLRDEDRTPADGYIDFGAGVIQVWEVE
jgi:hypothetical protein